MEPAQASRRDYGFLAFVLLITIIAVWLLLMPLVPAIASAALHRFHLRSSTFLWWAVQQPIPSMYAFANRYEVRESPPGEIDPVIETNQKRYINHFPTRVLTFANMRYRLLNDGRDRWVTIESTYRGQTIKTTLHAKPLPGGGFALVRLDTTEAAR